MLTQTIKNWLHKMFAWWPWKPSTEIEYSHAGNPLNKGTTQETIPVSTNDGVAPQAGIAPRLSTIEEWPERVVQSDFPVANEFTDTPPRASPSPGETNIDPIPPTGVQASPSPQQRLEFLQYLIKRGIVNEGFEEEM